MTAIGRTLDWITDISEWVIILYVVVHIMFVPMTIFRRTRMFSVTVIFIATWPMGAVLWVNSAIFLWVMWGIPGVIVGLFFAGIGIVPVALLAALIEWNKVILGEVLALSALTFVPRLTLACVLSRGGRRKADGVPCASNGTAP